MKKFGTAEIPDYIDQFIHDFFLEKLLEDDGAEAKILNAWVELKGNTIRFANRLKYWKEYYDNRRMEKAKTITNHLELNNIKT